MAVNQHIATRLEGIRAMLMGAHHAGSTMSTASRGSERAAFVDKFLCEVLTPQFRFGEGDATDNAGNRSGQLDVVVEYPWVPSLPVVGSNRPRLYLAEGVAAVIEVKSDLTKQWDEVTYASSQLKKLERQYGNSKRKFSGPNESPGLIPPNRIPLFAVGYTGWSSMATVKQHLSDGIVEGILIIDSGLFASVPLFQGITEQGDWSLWGLVTCLHQVTHVISSLDDALLLTYSKLDAEQVGAPDRGGR
jgi:hypothetical protein